MTLLTTLHDLYLELYYMIVLSWAGRDTAMLSLTLFMLATILYDVCDLLLSLYSGLCETWCWVRDSRGLVGVEGWGYRLQLEWVGFGRGREEGGRGGWVE